MKKQLYGFLLLSLFLLSACQKDKKQAIPPALVKAVPAKAQDTFIYVQALGHCSAEQAVDIKPQVSGELQSIAFFQGAFVKKGDLLARIDDQSYSAILKKAEAGLISNQAQLKLAESELERFLSLKEGGYVSQQELDGCQSRVDDLKAQVLASQAEIDKARIDLDHCVIKAPLTGKLGAQLQDPGCLVSAFGNPIVNLQKIDQLFIDFSLSEKDFAFAKPFLQENPHPQVQIQSLTSGKTATGEWLFYDNRVNMAVGSYFVRAKLANADYNFMPGEAIEITVLLKLIKNAVLVPEEAIQLGQSGQFIFVVLPNNTVEMRPVRAGQRQDQWCVISEGINAGEVVVTEGQLMLSPGRAVLVTNADKENSGK